MGSYNDKKSLGMLKDGVVATEDLSTQKSVNNGTRLTPDTFEYSTKGALGLDISLPYCTDTLSDATVEHVPQSFVDYQLQALHEDLVALPVPDRFLSLLDQLESKKDKGS